MPVLSRVEEVLGEAVGLLNDEVGTESRFMVN